MFNEFKVPKIHKRGKMDHSGTGKPILNKDIDETTESLISFRNRFALSKGSSPEVDTKVSIGVQPSHNQDTIPTVTNRSKVKVTDLNVQNHMAF